MDRLVLFNLILLCVIVIKTYSISAYDESESVTFEEEENEEPPTTPTTLSQDINDESGYNDKNQDYEDNEKDRQRAEGQRRSINSEEGLLPLNNPERHEAFRKRAKPLKSIFMGIYKNYKSTYLGNKTFAEYKRRLRTHGHGNESHIPNAEITDNDEESLETNEKIMEDDVPIESEAATSSTEANAIDNETYSMEDQNEVGSKSTSKESKTSRKRKTKKKKKQRSRKRNHRRKKHGMKNGGGAANKTKNLENSTYNYEFGPAANMSLDMSNEIVKLHLDGENLYEIMQGRWLKDKSEGRGKKYEMITRVLPLFIIPFLIQSAIVPFLVTKLKLLLMKSILVGKLAIFLLVISAFKNSSKIPQTYEVAPSYWAGEPSRRSELAAAASSATYNGYRVEGKPTAWIN